jgi:hypothetical protein
MAVLEAAIEIPGNVNGYHHNGPGIESDAVLDVEQLVRLRASQLPCDPAMPAEVDATPEATAAEPPTRTVGASKSTPAEGSRQASRPAKTRSTKAAKKVKPRDPRTRYVPQAALDAEQAKLETLSRAALAGDKSAVDELRIALDDCPHIWRRIADLQLQVELKLIGLVVGKDPLRAEAFRKRAAELRHHLLDGEPASLAVKMCASRVVACWLFAQYLELRALESPGDLRCIKQLEQAERRFGVAMRTFALTRQMDAQLQRLAEQGRSGR